MTSLPLLLLLVFCVSLHACTPCPLPKKETANYHFDKGSDKVKLPDTLEENQAQQQNVAYNEINICESCSSGVSTLKEMIVGATSGTSFQAESPSFLAAKDERRHARSMLGPVEETVTTNANDSTDNIVEMDYEQPHRKPPIHNEKP